MAGWLENNARENTSKRSNHDIQYKNTETQTKKNMRTSENIQKTWGRDSESSESKLRKNLE